MRLISIKEYAIRYKVSPQSVYARIRSGAVKEIIKDGIKYIEDTIEDIPSDNKDAFNAQSIEIQSLKDEIKRLKKALKKSERRREKEEDRVDRILDLILSKKGIPLTTGEVIDVALVSKKKKKKKR